MIDIKIFHFHFYKNAGSSVDAILKSVFNNKWEQREFEGSDHWPLINTWLEFSKDIICYSSHTANLDIINNQKFELFPIIFARHPIDRIASMYRYEKIQRGNEWEYKLARTSSMRQYIQARLDRINDVQCRNFHCNRLAELYRSSNKLERSDLTLAQNTIKILPFIGIVERFQSSLDVLRYQLERITSLRAHLGETQENATFNLSTPLDIRLEQIKHEIGSELFEELIKINQDDLLIYELIARKLDAQFTNLY